MDDALIGAIFILILLFVLLRSRGNAPAEAPKPFEKDYSKHQFEM